ncbi:MAG: HAMP domain-containing protein [Chloroflexi bacterium]|nr:MAG: HAMP domain-containing protein [Chloroflexota bacterium]
MAARAWAWLVQQGLQRHLQLLTVVSLLVVFAFFWVAGQHAIEGSIHQSLDSRLAVARLVASSLDDRLERVFSLLEQAAAQESLRSGPPGGLSTALLRETQLRLSAYGQHLYWLDADGRLLWAEPPDLSLLARPFPDFPIVYPALEKGARHVSNLCWPSGASQPYVLLAVPIPETTGEVSGLLVERIEADHLGLEPLLRQGVTGESSYIEVVDRRGVVIASSQPEHCFQKADHTDQFARLIEARQPLVGECHRCHTGEEGEAGQALRQTDEVLTFVPLQTAPWGVAVRQPARDVMAPLHRLQRLILLGGGAALIIVLLVTSWFIGRQIVGPIRALDEVSAQFAVGNLDVPVPAQGIDEVARLTAHLEQMRVRLETTLEDHRRWNEALEEMVEERTRELTTLYEQLQGKEAVCKQLLGKVLTAQEEERARLARELHDTIGQSLTAIIMTTMAVENSLSPDFVAGREKLINVRRIATQALRDLRNLIFDLRPEALDDLGLVLALRSQAKKCLEPAGVQVRLRSVGLEDRLPAEVEIAVFRVVQEAITNIARHAQATEANISLTRKGNKLIVRVEDDGVGFDPASVMQDEQKGWGLRGMEERITLLGGKFYIGSKPGQGTLVLAEVPLDTLEYETPAERHHALQR